ncbi:MAG: 16S rRNA (cytosine(1402)-N(4))-methyltransferase RsmH [Pseudomonadota bacterium]
MPVMLPQVLEALQPTKDDTLVDATFGAGGYTRAFLETGARVFAIDRDPDALSAGQALVEASGGRLTLLDGAFSQVEPLLNGHDVGQIDGLVADIGVSSMQIDQAARGFSFLRDGPLDMRMSQKGPSAAQVVNTFARSDLTRIIGILGEERQASRVAAEIAAQRERHPFETTGALASCVEKVLGRGPKDKIHPATRTFQALRIFVNRELEELADLLLAAERLLVEGGRLVLVTFHSLEDRLVKRFFQDRAMQASGSRHLPPQAQEAATFHLHKRGALAASDAEIAVNARSRSAKLRFGVRTAAPARSADRSLFGLPRLASLDVIGEGAR